MHVQGSMYMLLMMSMSGNLSILGTEGVPNACNLNCPQAAAKFA